ncbi:MAG: STAS domain-containing protein [Paracoccaceae bacterium]
MVKQVSLAPKLDTAASAELRKTLIAAVGDDVVLDATAVEMVGAACLELLLSAGAIWARSDHTITLENASSQMADDLGRFGLTPDSLLEYAA